METLLEKCIVDCASAGVLLLLSFIMKLTLFGLVQAKRLFKEFLPLSDKDQTEPYSAEQGSVSVVRFIPSTPTCSIDLLSYEEMHG